MLGRRRRCCGLQPCGAGASACEDLLDGVQVRRVFWQEQQLGFRLAECLTNGKPLVALQIVRDHDVAGTQGRYQDMFDVGLEPIAIDRAVKQPRRINPIVTQSGDEGHRVPMPVRHLGPQARPARPPTTQRRHVGLDGGLVDKDQSCRVNPPLVTAPLRPATDNVGAILLAGEHGFF